jgi:hypothetical protein
MKTILFAGTVLFALPLLAADPPKDGGPKAFTDAETAGPDFKIQGEYSGPVPGGAAGAQVVALGDGRFSVHVLGGGLPSEGWDGASDHLGSAHTAGGKTTFEVALPMNLALKGTIGDGALIGIDEQGQRGVLKRVLRRSPTEGLKPPRHAVVLFDGKSADAWDHGKIENGLLSVSVPGGQTSKQRFRDCTIHVEFILPFMPKARGQARANSGVFVDGRYEIQVLDSFGLEGKNNECGAIYSLAAPSINMCFPPLQWQTYDIEYSAPEFGEDRKKIRGARITVKHNGVPIHSDLEVKQLTPGNLLPDNAEPGPIHLQNHGNPVFYRNVWVVPKT